jgi:hypothetical protein
LPLERGSTSEKTQLLALLLASLPKVTGIVERIKCILGPQGADTLLLVSG